ncbi:hypothetical protein ABK040_010629 [Willaertia magna]
MPKAQQQYGFIGNTLGNTDLSVAVSSKNQEGNVNSGVTDPNQLHKYSTGIDFSSGGTNFGEDEQKEEEKGEEITTLKR